ncbi:MAG: aldo/keto reductase [Pseudomonadales bacterium]|nr:aldo/keto reductase [Pseudomonadales bacterium]MCP5193499.1 aldo/keto reductase [Pseudomonadales bacterium]
MRWLRPLGSTGIQVSALGLGTVKLGRNEAVKYPDSFTVPDDAGAARLLALARELGINLLDTAPAYGNSEQRLGRLLAGERRHWVICSKVGEEFEQGRSRFDFSPEHARDSVLRSLRRLRTDVLDIVLVHSDGDDLGIINRMGTLEALAQLKREGLLRAFGMSTKTVAGGLAAARACDVVMLTYNLQQPEELPVLDACAHLQCGALVKKALASGHLLPTAGTAAGPAASGLLQASMALALAHPGTSATIVGTINPAHLQANVAAARSALAPVTDPGESG